MTFQDILLDMFPIYLSTFQVGLGHSPKKCVIKLIVPFPFMPFSENNE